MTDDSLDRMIRRALLAAAEADYQQVMAQTTEEPPPSPAYQRWTRRFLKNPLAELRRTRRPVWKRILRTAACFLLMLSISFGTLMAASPQARAWVSRWFVSTFSTHVSYNYSEYVSINNMRKWEPTYLPKGYQQTEFFDLGGMVNIYYSNGDPDMKIKLSWQLMSEGNNFSLDNEHHIISNTTVNGMSGQLFTATNDVPNMLVWFDESSDHAFLLLSRVNCETLLRIAESVKQIE